MFIYLEPYRLLVILYAFVLHPWRNGQVCDLPRQALEGQLLPNRPAAGLILLMTEILHDFMCQNPRNYGSVVYSFGHGGFISSTVGLPQGLRSELSSVACVDRFCRICHMIYMILLLLFGGCSYVLTGELYMYMRWLALDMYHGSDVCFNAMLMATASPSPQTFGPARDADS